MITVNLKLTGADDFLAALKKHPEKIGRTADSILKQEARGLAVSLAYQTAPEGLGEKGGAKLEKKIAMEIRQLFPTAKNNGLIYKFIFMGNPELAKAYWRAYKSKDEKSVARILRVAALPRGIDAGAHQSARRKGSLSSFRPKAMSTEASLQAYIKRSQRKVGLAKAGWAAAAKSLGGRVRTRAVGSGKSVERIPKYIRALQKRDNIGGSSTKLAPRSSVRIWNIVPYINTALPDHRYQKALSEAQRSFVTALNNSVAYLNRNRFNRSSSK
jgi:hypothetical protein